MPRRPDRQTKDPTLTKWGGNIPPDILENFLAGGSSAGAIPAIRAHVTLPILPPSEAGPSTPPAPAPLEVAPASAVPAETSWVEEAPTPPAKGRASVPVPHWHTLIDMPDPSDQQTLNLTRWYNADGVAPPVPVVPGRPAFTYEQTTFPGNPLDTDRLAAEFAASQQLPPPYNAPPRPYYPDPGAPPYMGPVTQELLLAEIARYERMARYGQRPPQAD